MSADHIIDMAREVELRVRERALTEALKLMLFAVDQNKHEIKVSKAMAALALPDGDSRREIGKEFSRGWVQIIENLHKKNP